MPVGPDLLLQTSPDFTAKPTTRAPAKTADASRDEPSSFSRVYENERQAKPAEARETSTKASRGKDDGKDERVETAGETDGDPAPAAAAVAEAGNSLPAEDATTDDAPDEAELDPFLMLSMGMGDAAVTDIPVPPAAATAGGMPLQGGELAAQAPVTESRLGDDLDIMQALSGVKPGTEQGQVATLKNASDAAAAQPTAVGDDFAAVMQDMGTKLQADADKSSDEIVLDEASLDLSQGLPEAKSDNELRSDQFVGKLNALSQAIAQQNAAVQRSGAPVMQGGAVSMQQAGWSEAVVDRVMYLSSQNLKSAEIQLDPAELGRLEVRIEMDRDQTQVTFASPNAHVREQLEGQMHRLRDMFSQQGLSQLDVNVSDQSMHQSWQGQGEGSGQGRRAPSLADGGGSGDVDVEVGPVGATLSGAMLKAGIGLVDYYA